jgi:hypothetical protein
MIGTKRMSYTQTDLMAAIDEGDISLVRTILQERNSHHNPTVDINSLPAFGQKWTAFHYIATAVRLSATQRYEMLIAILNVCDWMGNPVINLNQPCSSLQNLNCLEILFKIAREARFSQEQVRTLADRIFNLRDSHGYRIYDFSNEASAVLNASIIYGDPDIVRALLDLRNRDGSFVIDVNQFHETFSPSYSFFTALDLAESREPPNQKIITLLQEVKAQHFKDISKKSGIIEDAKRPVRLETRPREYKAPASLSEAEKFNNNAQNVHRIEVEETTDNAIKALEKRYGAKLQVKESISELQKYILQQEKSENNELVQKGFNLVAETLASVTHSTSGLSMEHILSLVWEGAKDEECIPPDQPNVDRAQFCNLRKQALVDQFKEIATTYESANDSCINGIRNRLVTSLNKAHPDVSIAPTSGAAAADAYGAARSFQAEKLQSYKRAQQLIILQTWPDLLKEGKDQLESPAYQFHHSIREDVATKLENDYGRIVDQRRLRQITSPEFYNDMPRPPVYPPLDNLLSEISVIPLSNLLNDILLCCANNLFSEDRGSYEEDLKHLSAEYKTYKAIEKDSSRYQPVLTWLADLKTQFAKLMSQQENLKSASDELGKTQYKLVQSLTKEVDSTLQKIDFKALKTPEVLQASLLRAVTRLEKHKDYNLLAKSRSWGEALANFKNVLLFVPVLGWSVAGYRHYHRNYYGGVFYDTRPKTQQCVDNFKSTVSKFNKK